MIMLRICLKAINAQICADQMYTKSRLDLHDVKTLQIKFYKHIKRMLKKL